MYARAREATTTLTHAVSKRIDSHEGRGEMYAHVKVLQLLTRADSDLTDRRDVRAREGAARQSACGRWR